MKKTLLRVVNSEREHASKHAERFDRPAAEGFENRFSIAVRAKHALPWIHQPPDFLKVINFAVEYDPVPAGMLRHGLMSRWGRIQDGQPGVAQTQYVRTGTKRTNAMIVRATVFHTGHHRVSDLVRFVPRKIAHNPCNTAHLSVPWKQRPALRPS